MSGCEMHVLIRRWNAHAILGDDPRREAPAPYPNGELLHRRVQRRPAILRDEERGGVGIFARELAVIRLHRRSISRGHAKGGRCGDRLCASSPKRFLFLCVYGTATNHTPATLSPFVSPAALSFAK